MWLLSWHTVQNRRRVEDKGPPKTVRTVEVDLREDLTLDSGMDSVRGGVLPVGKICGQVRRNFKSWKHEDVVACSESCKQEVLLEEKVLKEDRSSRMPLMTDTGSHAKVFEMTEGS